HEIKANPESVSDVDLNLPPARTREFRKEPSERPEKAARATTWGDRIATYEKPERASEAKGKRGVARAGASSSSSSSASSRPGRRGRDASFARIYVPLGKNGGIRPGDL